MADNDKRLLELPDINYSDDLYFMTEKSGSVTSKIQADKVKLKVDTSLATAGKAADAKATGDAINAEAAARQQAISSEVTDRNSAISAAIGTEVTNRNAAIDAAYNDLDEKKADNNLLYSDLSAGTSEELSSDNGVTDTTPYLTRKCSAIGDRAREVELVGGSVAWNQLAPVISSDKWTANTSYSTIAFDNGKATLTMTAKNGSQSICVANGNGGIPMVKGHRYLVSFDIKLSETSTGITVCAMNDQYVQGGGVTANTWTRKNIIFASTQNTGGNAFFGVYPALGTAGLSVGATMEFKNCTVTDLTLLFGSTIADYIASLETAKAGAGAAWFKRYYPLDYYPYNAGSLDSVEVTKKIATGFNQLDEDFIPYGSTQLVSRNPIPILPNTQYYLYCSNSAGCTVYFYKDTTSGNIGYTTQTNHVFTTPSEARYFKVYTGSNYGATYKNDICVNLSDPNKNGTYEPYKGHTYNYGNVVLRGVPKLVDGELTYDGDIRKPNGTVIRNYLALDLGSLTWAYHSDLRLFYTYLNEYNVKANNGGVGYPVVCSKYADYYDGTNRSSHPVGYYDKAIQFGTTSLTGSKNILIYDSSLNGDASALKTSLNGVYAIIPCATPTTESVDPYSEYQYVSNEGIEKYVTNNYTPVGHTTFYMESQKKKLDVVTYPAEAIVKTSSGAIASFDDGGNNYPMKSLKVNIVPKQAGSGDPSPSNVRAISGWTQARIGINSKNYFPFPPGVKSVTKNGITWTLYKDEYGRLIKIKAKGTATASTSFSFTSTALGHYWLPKGHYKLLILGDVPSASGIWDLNIRKEGSDTDIVATTGIAEITLTEMTEFKSAYFYVYNNHTIDAEFCPAILQFNDTTPSLGQAPCVPPTVPLTIPFGQTVYGGTLDVVSGKLIVDRAIADLGDYEWSYYSQYSAFFGTPAIPSTYGDFVCSKYKYAGVTETLSELTGKPDKSVLNRVNSGTVHSICVKDSSYTDGATFRTGATGTKLVYFLATPIEIDLTPTEVKSLLGDNNVWSDSGSVEVEYRADTTLAYNKLMAMIASLA